MTYYEYQTWEGPFENLAAALNELGAAGWDLYEEVLGEYCRVLLVKRQRVETTDAPVSS